MPRRTGNESAAPYADYVAVDPTCRYKGHKHSHCDCPWWRRWWHRDRSRPIYGVSGTIVMPEVHLPEGYVPPSAAVPPPTHSGGGDAC